MKDNSKLGRSIEDLIKENESYVSSNEIIEDIALEDIVANPGQPRTVFDEIKLNELSKSIKQHGILQPVILKKGATGYILVAGERRVRAAELANLKTIPAIVRNYNTRYLPELAMIENLQREDLTPIEEAIAFQNILFQTNITHQDLADKIGKSRVYVTNTIGLLNLPKEVIDAVNNERLTMGHARALSKLKNIELCLSLFKRVLVEQLTVRELEEIIRNTKTPQKSLNKSNLRILKDVFRESFSNLNIKVNKDKLVITFKDDKELTDFINFLKEE